MEFFPPAAKQISGKNFHPSVNLFTFEGMKLRKLSYEEHVK